jgi:hypothetical protein
MQARTFVQSGLQQQRHFPVKGIHLLGPVQSDKSYLILDLE